MADTNASHRALPQTTPCGAISYFSLPLPTVYKAPSVKQVVFTTGTNDVKDSDNKVLNVNTKLASYSQSGNKTPTTGSITGDGTVISAINYQACKIDSAGLNLYKQAETIVDGVTTNNTPDYVEIVVLRACTMIVTPTGNKIYVSKTKRDVTGTQYAESTEHKIPLAVGTWYINTNNNAAKVASLTFEYEISN